MKIEDLKTPAALIDLDRLERNASRMAERCDRLGVRLRPHVKTHKCVEAARIQTASSFGGITVSTLAEARGFAAAGFDDICWAVPVALDRLEECVELHHRLRAFHLLLDHPGTLGALEHCAAARETRLSVFLEVDCGLRRSGVDPEREDSVELALALHRSAHLDFGGLLSHAGQSYACSSRDQVAVVARHERDVVLGFAERLRVHGMAVPDLSIGSTPTVMAIDDVDGITELRPGNYLFFDAFQAAIGSCSIDDVALSVLASVIACDPEAGRAVVNAGALALSTDPGPTHVDPGCGFGLPAAVGGQSPLPGLRLARLNQEHGMLEGPGAVALRPGDRLRILPNHSCLAAACFDSFHVVRGDEVVDEWHSLRGW